MYGSRFLKFFTKLAGAILQLALLLSADLCAQENENVDDLLRRLKNAEKRIESLESQIAEPARQLESATFADEGSNDQTIEQARHFEGYEAGYALIGELSRNSPLPASSKFFADYDGGFVIRPFDEQSTPFELQINGRMQIRHVGFDRNEKFYSNRGDTARGGPLRVANRNDFDIERARLMFSGFVYDPNLQFFLNLDGDTDDNHVVIVQDFWFNYKFSEAFDLYFGKAFVPGSRAWLDGSLSTHLADRSMSTTFFRPDRSVGVWAIGKFAEDMYYRVMIANGFNASDLRFSEIDTSLAYSGSMWWDAIGDYGSGYADLEWHEEPAVRIGHSFTFSDHSDVESGRIPLSEQNFVRLSDGTLLATPSALAPGVTVLGSDLYLYAIDAAFKYRGWSFNTELYFRWLNQFDTNGGPIPYAQLYADGFYFDAGYMLVEKSLEVVGRVSFVDGLFANRWEYAAGVNWYVNGTYNNKVTFDLSVLDGSPAQNTGPDYEIGQDGLLTRVQWQIAF